MAQLSPAAEELGGGSAPGIGVGLIGFGWLGQAHSRSLLRIPTLFAGREFDTELVICADNVPARQGEAVEAFGYAGGRRRLAARGRARGRRRRLHHSSPNMLHLELIEAAAAAAGKDIFCEKPVGGTPEQTERAAEAARRSSRASVTTTAGRRSCSTPGSLIADGRLGEITNYRGASSRCTAATR